MPDPIRATSQKARTTAPAQAERSMRSKPLGQILVALGVLDSRQLATVLELQKMQSPEERLPLGRICVEEGLISRERLDLILERWGKRLRLGELLVHQGTVTPAQLEEALERQRSSGARLGAVLLEMGVLDEVALTETLARQYDMAYIPLGDLSLSRDLVRYVNPQYAWRHGVVPIGRIGRRLTVAIQDPTNPELLQDLERSTGMQIKAVLSTPSHVAAIARRLYDLDGEESPRPASPADGDVGAPASPPDLLRRLVTRAASLSATELFLEPTSNGGEIRLRLADTTWPVPDADLFTQRIPDLIRAFQTLSRLDPSDPKRPQEGFLSVTTDEGDFSRPVLLRIETEPTPSGQAMRAEILPEGGGLTAADLDGVGTRRAEIESLLSAREGVVLIVGPPGSRKRNLLRGMIPVLSRSEALVYSIEEPILRLFEDVEQHQVASPDGPGYLERFDRLLEHDPDAIVLERIPDPAVARRIFDIEGERPLVVATLQGGNATASVARLSGMEVDPERIARGLRGVVAVRLLRRVCPSCQDDYEPERAVLDEWFGSGDPFSRWIRGAGCSSCRGTGSLGRIVVLETWAPDDRDREEIRRGADPAALRRRFLDANRCLGQDALRAAVEGTTTLEEALRQIPYQDVLHARQRGIEQLLADRSVAAPSPRF